MTNPNPVPLNLVVKKGVPTNGIVSSLMPTPVSLMIISIHPSSGLLIVFRVSTLFGVCCIDSKPFFKTFKRAFFISSHSIINLQITVWRIQIIIYPSLSFLNKLNKNHNHGLIRFTKSSRTLTLIPYTFFHNSHNLILCVFLN